LWPVFCPGPHEQRLDGTGAAGMVSSALDFRTRIEDLSMAKPHRTLKKANHGSRPANSKARKAKRKHIRT